MIDRLELFSRNELQALSPATVRNILSEILATPDADTRLERLKAPVFILVPELAELAGPRGEQDHIYHPEGNVWTHTLMVIKMLKELQEKSPSENRLNELWAALFHDVAKPQTQQIVGIGHTTTRITNYYHAEQGAEVWQQVIGPRLQFPPETIEMIAEIIYDHMKMHQRHRRQSVLQSLVGGPYAWSKVRLQYADALGTTYAGREDCVLFEYWSSVIAAFEKAAEQKARQESQRLVTGKQLIAWGYQSGPGFGKIIEAAKTAQHAGAFSDLASAETWVAAQSFACTSKKAQPAIAWPTTQRTCTAE